LAGIDSLYLQFKPIIWTLITHVNTPTLLSWFKKVSFRHYYVIQKKSILLKLSSVTFAELFTSPLKI